MQIHRHLRFFVYIHQSAEMAPFRVFNHCRNPYYMNILTVIVTIEVSTLQMLPIAGVSCPEWRMFQPTVLVSLMESERSATSVLFSGTRLSTVAKASSTEVPEICTPIVNIVLNTHLESPWNEYWWRLIFSSFHQGYLISMKQCYGQGQGSPFNETEIFYMTRAYPPCEILIWWTFYEGAIIFFLGITRLA